MKISVSTQAYWPYIGVFLALLILVYIWLDGLALSEPRPLILLLFASVMFYHFELHIFPGGFNRWMNKSIFSSRVANTPLNRQRSFVIDAVILWSLTGWATLLSSTQVWLGAVCLFLFLNRAWFHLSSTITSGHYSPGLIVSVILFIPLTGYVSHLAINEQWLGWSGLTGAVVVGTLLHTLLFIVLRLLVKKDAKRGL